MAPGAVAITGSLFQNPDTFGASEVALATFSQDVTGSLFQDPDTFGASEVVRILTVNSTLFADPDFFGSGSVTLVQPINATFFADPDFFGSNLLVNSRDAADPIPVNWTPPPPPKVIRPPDRVGELRRELEKRRQRDALARILDQLMPSQAELDAMRAAEQQIGGPERPARLTIERDDGIETTYIETVDKETGRRVFKTPFL